MVIPVFPGTNCEYDTARAFERAGAVASTLVINNLTPEAVAESTHELVRRIKESQIVMLPGGFSGGDEPDGSAKLTFNTIGRHQSRLVRTRVASNLSPWLSKCSVDDVHTIAISHGEGRFVACPELVERLAAAGQIATQYVDENGEPGMGLDVNPNGSVLAVEGITSPDGRVLGKMGHTERSGEGLYKNVPGNKYQPLIEGGVSYFTD